MLKTPKEKAGKTRRQIKSKLQNKKTLKKKCKKILKMMMLLWTITIPILDK